MFKTAEVVRDEILKDILEALSELRETAMSLPDDANVAAVIDAIEFWENVLPTVRSAYEMVEWSGRALADVTHEIAAAEFGWGSPEEEATFDEQERNLNNLLFELRTGQRRCGSWPANVGPQISRKGDFLGSF